MLSGSTGEIMIVISFLYVFSDRWTHFSQPIYLLTANKLQQKSLVESMWDTRDVSGDQFIWQTHLLLFFKFMAAIAINPVTWNTLRRDVMWHSDDTCLRFIRLQIDYLLKHELRNDEWKVNMKVKMMLATMRRSEKCCDLCNLYTIKVFLNATRRRHVRQNRNDAAVGQHDHDFPTS